MPKNQLKKKPKEKSCSPKRSKRSVHSPIAERINIAFDSLTWTNVTDTHCYLNFLGCQLGSVSRYVLKGNDDNISTRRKHRAIVHRSTVALLNEKYFSSSMLIFLTIHFMIHGHHIKFVIRLLFNSLLLNIFSGISYKFEINGRLSTFHCGTIEIFELMFRFMTFRLLHNKWIYKLICAILKGH